jgi:hypothetical protein
MLNAVHEEHVAGVVIELGVNHRVAEQQAGEERQGAPH